MANDSGIERGEPPTADRWPGNRTWESLARHSSWSTESVSTQNLIGATGQGESYRIPKWFPTTDYDGPLWRSAISYGDSRSGPRRLLSIESLTTTGEKERKLPNSEDYMHPYGVSASTKKIFRFEHTVLGARSYRVVSSYETSRKPGPASELRNRRVTELAEIACVPGYAVYTVR